MARAAAPAGSPTRPRCRPARARRPAGRRSAARPTRRRHRRRGPTGAWPGIDTQPRLRLQAQLSSVWGASNRRQNRHSAPAAPRSEQAEGDARGRRRTDVGVARLTHVAAHTTSSLSANGIGTKPGAQALAPETPRDSGASRAGDSRVRPADRSRRTPSRAGARRHAVAGRGCGRVDGARAKAVATQVGQRVALGHAHAGGRHRVPDAARPAVPGDDAGLPHPHDAAASESARSHSRAHTPAACRPRGRPGTRGRERSRRRTHPRARRAPGLVRTSRPEPAEWQPSVPRAAPGSVERLEPAALLPGVAPGLGGHSARRQQLDLTRQVTRVARTTPSTVRRRASARSWESSAGVYPARPAPRRDDATARARSAGPGAAVTHRGRRSRRGRGWRCRSPPAGRPRC